MKKRKSPPKPVTDSVHRSPDIEVLLEKERKFRESLNFLTTPDEIDRFKRMGRL